MRQANRCNRVHTTCLFHSRRRAENCRPLNENCQMDQGQVRGYPPRESDSKWRAPAECESSLNFSGVTRASGEVCPKHRNNRRENLRVRFRFNQVNPWRAMSGNVFCSLCSPCGHAHAAFGVRISARQRSRPPRRLSAFSPLFHD